MAQQTYDQGLMPVVDPVNHPAHYKLGSIEVIDAIDSWKLGFSLGNAVKYIARAGKKDPAKLLEDLQKARWYLDREIARLSAVPVANPVQYRCPLCRMLTNAAGHCDDCKAGRFVPVQHRCLQCFNPLQCSNPGHCDERK